MPWWTLAALGVFLASVLIGLALSGTVALRGWWLVRRLRRTLGLELDALLVQVEGLESRLAGLTDSEETLRRALERLSGSQARLAVLQWALADARSTLQRFRSVLPRP